MLFISTIYIYIYISPSFRKALENGTFIDELPIENRGFTKSRTDWKFQAIFEYKARSDAGLKWRPKRHQTGFANDFVWIQILGL